MKGNLQTRVARLERALPPEKDDLYLGTVDEQGTIKAPPTEPADWHEQVMKVAAQLALTMSEEHFDLVLRESCDPEKELEQMSNLAYQFWRIAKFMVDCENDRGSTSNRKRDSVFHGKRDFALPLQVSQIYIDHPLATAGDECRQCGCLYPVLLWTGSSTHASARATASLNLPLHPGYNCFQFFISCLLCGGATGGTPEPADSVREFRRIERVKV